RSCRTARGAWRRPWRRTPICERHSPYHARGAPPPRASGDFHCARYVSGLGWPATEEAMTREIPRLSGAGARFRHLMALRHGRLGLFQRVRRECGELGMFRMLDRDVAFFSGPEAQEVFFRQPDEVFDPQPTSNELMRPIFGPGVVYDVPPEKRREM